MLSEIIMDLEIALVVVSEIRIPVDLETKALVDSEMEILADLEAEIQMEVSEIQIQEDSVIRLLNNSQDITMVVSDQVIPEALETIMADLIIPVVVSDPVVHLAVEALEVVHPVEVVDLDPVASDNIQLHKNY